MEGTISSRKRHAIELFEGLPRRYDELAAALSFWQDPRWRRAMVATVEASADDRVLDVAAGTGLVAGELVRRYGCRVTALDQSAAMLARARAKLASDQELARRVELVEGEAERLPFADREFDHLTFTYLLRYVDDPVATMRELARVVRPGGRVSSLEFCVPPGPLLWAWRLYTRAFRDRAHVNQFRRVFGPVCQRAFRLFGHHDPHGLAVAAHDARDFRRHGGIGRLRLIAIGGWATLVEARADIDRDEKIRVLLQLECRADRQHRAQAAIAQPAPISLERRKIERECARRV